MRSLVKLFKYFFVSALIVAPSSVAAEDLGFLALGAGYYDVYQKKHKATEFRAEYRSGEKIWIFKPLLGVMGTSDTAIYGYGGFLVDVFFGRRFVLTPSLSAGYYENGDGRDLGYGLEFRSSIEFSYRFDNRARLGLAFYHLSNANLGDFNPGTEVLSVLYSIPLSSRE